MKSKKGEKICFGCNRDYAKPQPPTPQPAQQQTPGKPIIRAAPKQLPTQPKKPLTAIKE
jgi:hypothetical protein